MRLAILQRVCTSYRLALFQKLSAQPDLQLHLYFGDNLPKSKVRSVRKVSGIEHSKLPTRFFRFRNRTLVDHRGLVPALKDFQPDVIFCEGESHFLAYLQALRYRRRNKKCALVMWSLIGLPGVKPGRKGLAGHLKSWSHKQFDAFVVYSSFSRQLLIELGHDPAKVFVATNVADTKKLLLQADQFPVTRQQARRNLSLPQRFTVLYAGAMDANKRPDLLLDLAGALNPEHYNFVLLGDGERLEPLRARAQSERLANVFLPGRVEKELATYFRAADTMILPGRGGMVISEAMAWSLPVVVHQADGTEFDLVRDHHTGLHLPNGALYDFKNALELLRNSPEQTRQWGLSGRQRIAEYFSMDHIVDQVVRAAQYAAGQRT
jgi:glycosyltransferase involved in cell wall biosynthesis